MSEPIQAWSITVAEERAAPAMPLAPAPAPHAPAAGQILCPVVVGRESELTQAAAALDAALASHGQTVVLAAEAGGGKTAFVRELEQRARERGFRVLIGATLESDTALPYSPLVAAVRSGFRGIERERLGRVLAQMAPDLAQLFPELGRAARADGAAPMEQHRLSVAFHGLFTAFAREAPILVVLEDLHWSDEASLDLLHYLARELRDSRSLLLATYRSDEMHRRHPFLRTLASLQRERLVTEIALRRLTVDEVATLIRETFATTTAVSAEFRDAVYARCEGNPFFTEELLKALVESGGIYRTATGWERKPVEELRIPTSIREAVHGRIERLSAEAQATLSAASVIGLRFPFAVLRATAGGTPADVLAHLRQFIELQLVIEEGGEDDLYAFRHALTREVVYDELLAPERKALHHGIAAVLEARPRTEPALLALHLVAAGEQQRALPHLLEAADRAMATGAPREAATHYERALEIGVSEADLPRTYEALARVYRRFDFTRGRRAAERALALYRKADDHRGISRTLLILSDDATILADTRARALIDEAVTVVEGLGDTVELAHALGKLGFRAGGLGVIADIRRLADRLLALGERLHDEGAIARAYQLQGVALMNDRPAAGLELIVRGQDLAIQSGRTDIALGGYLRTTGAMTYLRRPREEIFAVIDAGLSYARDHGIEETPLIPARAYYHLNHAEWDEALESAQRIERSTWYDNVVEIRARIAEGREGPASAATLYREHARAWRALTGEARPPALISTAYAALLSDERAAGTAALEELGRLGASPVQLINSGWSLLLLCATLLDRPKWIDAVEPLLQRGEWTGMRAGAAACRAGRAFLAGDAAECGRLLSTMAGLDAPPSHFGIDTANVDYIIGLVREARSRGWTVGPEWDGALSSARAFAEKAKARPA